MNYRVPRTRKEIFETLIKGLQRLEYRGYMTQQVWQLMEIIMKSKKGICS